MHRQVQLHFVQIYVHLLLGEREREENKRLFHNCRAFPQFVKHKKYETNFSQQIKKGILSFLLL